MYHASWILSGMFFVGAFVAGGELESPAIFVVGEVLAVAFFVYAMYLSLRVIRAGDPRLLKRGIRGTAIVLQAHRTNTVMQAGEFEWMAPWVWRYHLQVTIPDHEPYETVVSICAGGMSEGQTVDIAAAPQNHKRVTIDVGQDQGKGAGSASTDRGVPTSLSFASADTPAGDSAPKFDPGTGAPTGAPTGGDSISKLERLANLRDRGVLTDDELAEQKRKLLNDG